MRILLLCFLTLYLIQSSYQETIKLPDPVKEGGMPLYEALNKRHTQRDFDPTKKVTPEIISQALWSCYGINRPDSKLRTVPSAKAWLSLKPYVFLEEGVYLYNPGDHSLTQVLEGDYREYTGTQDFVKDARIDFVFICDFKKKSAMDPDDEHKKRSIYLDTGHVTMSLYLFAATNGMKGVSRAMVDTAKLFELLGLKEGDYYFTLAFSLGY